MHFLSIMRVWHLVSSHRAHLTRAWTKSTLLDELFYIFYPCCSSLNPECETIAELFLNWFLGVNKVGNNLAWKVTLGSATKPRFRFSTPVGDGSHPLHIMSHSGGVGHSLNIPPIVPARHTPQLYLCLLIICQSVLWCWATWSLTSFWNFKQPLKKNHVTTVPVSFRIKAFYSRKQPPLILPVWNAPLCLVRLAEVF